jgi:hypothetical protein
MDFFPDGKSSQLERLLTSARLMISWIGIEISMDMELCKAIHFQGFP